MCIPGEIFPSGAFFSRPESPLPYFVGRARSCEAAAREPATGESLEEELARNWARSNRFSVSGVLSAEGATLRMLGLIRQFVVGEALTRRRLMLQPDSSTLE